MERRALDRQVGGLGALQDLVHKDGGALACLAGIRPIGQQAPGFGTAPPTRHGRQSMPEREHRELLPVRGKEGGIHGVAQRFLQKELASHLLRLDVATLETLDLFCKDLGATPDHMLTRWTDRPRGHGNRPTPSRKRMPVAPASQARWHKERAQVLGDVRATLGW
jgi:hypothetical protein